jgi:hypothetical protein
MDWAPQQEGLQQLLQLLHGSISPDNAVQTAVQEVSVLVSVAVNAAR